MGSTQSKKQTNNNGSGIRRISSEPSSYRSSFEDSSPIKRIKSLNFLSGFGRRGSKSEEVKVTIVHNKSNNTSISSTSSTTSIPMLRKPSSAPQLCILDDEPSVSPKTPIKTTPVKKIAFHYGYSIENKGSEEVPIFVVPASARRNSVSPITDHRNSYYENDKPLMKMKKEGIRKKLKKKKLSTEVTTCDVTTCVQIDDIIERLELFNEEEQETLFKLCLE
ncbi:hypothetical protein ABK040_005117 [Willaertia magna]